MELQQIKRKDTLDHPAGVMIKLTIDGQKLESVWHISNTILTNNLKNEPGVKFYNGNGELKGHLYLNQYGNYEFTTYKKPKPTIQSIYGTLEFWNEVDDADKAQDILDGFRHAGTPAMCLHKHSRHQVYVKPRK